MMYLLLVCLVSTAFAYEPVCGWDFDTNIIDRDGLINGISTGDNISQCQASFDHVVINQNRADLIVSNWSTASEPSSAVGVSFKVTVAAPSWNKPDLLNVSQGNYYGQITIWLNMERDADAPSRYAILLSSDGFSKVRESMTFSVPSGDDIMLRIPAPAGVAMWPPTTTHSAMSRRGAGIADESFVVRIVALDAARSSAGAVTFYGLDTDVVGIDAVDSLPGPFALITAEPMFLSSFDECGCVHGTPSLAAWAPFPFGNSADHRMIRKEPLDEFEVPVMTHMGSMTLGRFSTVVRPDPADGSLSLVDTRCDCRTEMLVKMPPPPPPPQAAGWIIGLPGQDCDTVCASSEPCFSGAHQAVTTDSMMQTVMTAADPAGDPGMGSYTEIATPRGLPSYIPNFEAHYGASTSCSLTPSLGHRRICCCSSVSCLLS
eukprot:TRINITY_DN218_c0_g1_i1.p1 TRINITY_DN218_c0_g1~~TRINITY_DN218_c0_g1_i1.p1  ORF type:complete len:431 (+),score=32.92 TRINITY_DN218_c0_g1_i1:88-1380(+)